MKNFRLCSFSCLFVICLVLSPKVHSADADSLNTAYSKGEFIKSVSAEDSLIGNLISRKFSKSNSYSCFQVRTNRFFKSVYFLVDTAKSVLVIIPSYTSPGLSYSIMDIKKVNDSLLYASTSLHSQDNYRIEPISVVFNSKDLQFYYKWTNPSGKNEPHYSGTSKLFRGEPFPGLTFRTADGKEFTLTKNKITAINWWNTYCVPCREEIPGFNTLVEKYKDRNDISFIAVVADSENLDKFLKKNRFDYLQCISDKEMKENFGNAYPRNIIIDYDGRMIYDHLGGSPATYLELDAVINNLINSKKQGEN